jgi:uncharacterized membrane protein
MAKSPARSPVRTLHDATPPPPPHDEGVGARMSDRATELVVSWLLRVGVWTSITVITIGIAMLLVSDPAAMFHGHSGGLNSILNDQLSGQPRSLTTYGGVASSLAHGQAFGVIMLGLLILLATPVLRVAVSIVAFLLERDRLYAVVTSIVLALLLTSIFLGKAGG